jgi:asparagine synthase (glutamine-hydrolysing)
MIHRGPDESGYFLDANLGLAQRRLSIIDLATGRQPLFNEDRSVAAVANGEIYNYQELRESLIAKGHRFYTRSDCEVIVHLYEDWGEDFVSHLRGMFAIALWDRKARKLVLVRDRMGIKPLFYAATSERLVFASEVNAIVRAPGWERKVNPKALHDYLSFMTTAGRDTLFDGIHRLLPAELLVCTGRKVQRKIYWKPEEECRPRPFSLEEFRNTLQEVCRIHLASDVPVGAFLSGGLDSSAVVALMSRILNRPIQTFSIGFSGNQYYNELAYARQVAEHCGTEHHEYVVTPDVAGTVPKIIEHFGEPFAVSSALPTYFLAKLAREKVKVVLTGDGADELMGGYYHRYLAVRLGRIFDRVPALTGGTRAVAKFLGNGRRRKLNKFLAGLSYPSPTRYFRYLTKFQEEEKMELYSPETRAAASGFDSRQELLEHFDRSPDGDLLNKWLYVDLKTTLPNEMMAKVDGMTMASGLEARVPFLDHVLVERVLSLPSSLKLRGLTSKFLLRKAVAEFLPKPILARAKHGFEVPMDDWIRGELHEYVNDYLNEERIAREGFFRWPTVERLLDRHNGHRANLGHQIWILLMFEVWHEKYFR